MKIIRSVWRFSALLVHIFLGIFLTIIYSFVLRRSHTSASYRRLVRWWLGRIIRILGGRVHVIGAPAADHTLMVCNHVSWLDIPLLGGQSSIRFLSKSEVRHWPVVGWLASKAGTLYIERGRNGAARSAADSITQSLARGDVVMLFPEGTTSDGWQVLPFHARLFTSAIEAQAKIQPVAIRYLDESGALSPHVPYVGDMSLWDNLTGLLPRPYFSIEVHYLPVLNSTEQTRRALANLSELQIRKVLSS
ncbi:MAG: lysophospholipid acyltransferase family protein [Thiolinea sp.]